MNDLRRTRTNGRTPPDSIPARIHAQEEKLKVLEKKMNSLSDGDTSFGDMDLKGKLVKFSLDGPEEEIITGVVVGVSKYTVRVQLGDKRVLTIRKTFIRWEEVLDEPRSK